jgi:hypothetical protein
VKEDSEETDNDENQDAEFEAGLIQHILKREWTRHELDALQDQDGCLDPSNDECEYGNMSDAFELEDMLE